MIINKFFYSPNMHARIFKVTTPNRVERSLVSGSDMEELLSDACSNLDVTYDASCQVCPICYYNKI